MKAKIVPIGNSKGIRIPNHILKLFNINTQVELIVDENKNEIILKPIKNTRNDWDKHFENMNQKKHDELIIDDSIDLEDWEW
jgi:antitoxin MazE